MKKRCYGPNVSNYEWEQTYKCGCKKYVSISANEPGSYERSISEKKRLEKDICCKCYMKH